MRWRKLGLVYCPSGDFAWARQYAHLPTPVLLGDRVRIFYAGLDDRKRGSIGFVDVDVNDPSRIIHIANEPVLSPGEPGLFDDSGVNPSCVVRHEDRWRMYYIGWQRSQGVPYALLGGLAISSDGLHFEKVQRVPILERTNAEPFLRSAPFVIDTRAWYVSATEWIDVHGKPYPRYVVRLAESTDGIRWSDCGPACIELRDDEFGIGRPWVIQDRDRLCMWYSIRSHSQPYRLGYAESLDGERWTRLDNRVGINASSSGWDSEMICYAAVIDVNGRRFMFYNGNQHGASGFGVAILEHD